MMILSKLASAAALTIGLCLGSAAQAQNILILTTGGLDSGAQPENTFMRGIIQEFAAPLTLTTCNSTPQTVTDPVSGLSKTVTCNSSELVNGSALNPGALFAPGYDLVVVASAYTTIDAADWPQLQTAIANRTVRGAVLFIDTINSTNATQVRPLLSSALNSPVPALGNGSAFPGINAHALNTAATGASDFAGILNSFTMGAGYYPYTNVPYANALYLASGAGPVASGVTAAVGVFVPSATSFNGNGACIFGANDIGWGNTDLPSTGWAANNGKVGTAFLKSFNNPTGPCAAPIAIPPELDITKTTTFSTTALPFNGSTVPYTITVSNTSAALANNVTVTDNAPAGLSFGQWSCSVLNAGLSPATVCPSPLPTGNLNASINLSANAQLQFTVNATVLNNQQELTNVATLGLPAGATCAGGRTPCNATVAFSPLPAELDITKTTTANTLALPANGSTVPYTITVRNPSSGSASNVTLTDATPAGMAFGSWSCTVVNPGTGQASTCPSPLPSGNLSTVLNLSAGAQLQFTVSATVADNQQALINVATLGLPAGTTCVGGRTPCDATVQFTPTPVVVPTEPRPVPALGGAGLGLLGLLLGALRLRMRKAASQR